MMVQHSFDSLRSRHRFRLMRFYPLSFFGWIFFFWFLCFGMAFVSSSGRIFWGQVLAPQFLDVHLVDDESVRIGKRLLSFEQLRELLEARFSSSFFWLRVHGADSYPYGRLMSFLLLLRSAGFARVILVSSSVFD